MRIINYVFILAIVLLGVSFACLNAQSVNINLYIGQFELPLSLLLVISFGIGALIGLFIPSFKYLRLKRENRKLNNRAKWAEQEVSNLRAIPLKDER